MKFQGAGKLEVMENSTCEIVLVQNSSDPFGYPCGKDAHEACSDCGTALCDLHSDGCEVCDRTFCDSCLYVHLKFPHAKPAVGSSKESHRRSA